MFTNMAGSPSHNQNGQGRPANNQETHIPFVSSTNAIPADIGSMFMNMTGNGGTSPGQGAQSGQNGENGAHPFSNFASMFMNMAGSGPQGQNPQGQPQGRNNAHDDPGIGLGGGTSFSFNFNDVASEELNRTVRSMMGMFSREPQGDQQNNNGDGRSASR